MNTPLTSTILFFLLLIPFLGNASELQSPLPETMEIRLEGKVIRGNLYHRESAENDRPTPPEDEGFIYEPKDDDRDQFEVRAWSSKGRQGLILAAAEKKLLDVVNKSHPPENEPVGYALSGRNKRELGGGKSARMSSTVARSSDHSKKVEPRSLTATPVTPATTTTVSPAEKTALCGCTHAVCWLWLLWLFLLIALLLLLAWRLRHSLKKFFRRK